jgi:hypothetical protein
MEIRISQSKAAEMSEVQQAGETALLTRLEALQVRMQFPLFLESGVH